MGSHNLEPLTLKGITQALISIVLTLISGGIILYHAVVQPADSTTLWVAVAILTAVGGLYGINIAVHRK